MRTRQGRRQFPRRQYRNRLSSLFQPNRNKTILQKGGSLAGCIPPGRIPDTLSRQSAFADNPRRRVVVIDNRSILRGLRRKDSRLRLRVLRKTRVPIQMIRRDIGQNSNLRRKLFHPFQLETADLGDDDFT
jgi:hypothetical protein